MDERELQDCLIIEAVRQLCRLERLNGPVLPFHIYAHGEEFGIYSVEGTIRRHMARLANEGRLIRAGDRKGYLIPDWRRMTLDVSPRTGSEWMPFDYAFDNDLLDEVG